MLCVGRIGGRSRQPAVGCGRERAVAGSANPQEQARSAGRICPRTTSQEDRVTQDINATPDDAAIGSPKHKAPPAPAATEPVTDRVGGLRRESKRLEVRDLNLYYGSFQAVADVNMAARPRSVTALIGPSGCGKSTVLRALNRMHETILGARVEGSVLLDDEDIYGTQISSVGVRRIVGMVFQRPNPFPTMSIRDNVVAGLKLQGMRNKKSLNELAERSLRGVNLWNEVKDRLDKPGGSLSGGQQQRLCIARAIAVSPNVLLMDEPCSALDPISTLAIEDLIAELKEDYTIIIVTHNMQQAARVSDQTAFFNLEATGKPGRLIEINDTEKVFSTPDQKATEDYISGRFG
jgi:phosphate transport system ATP-binding protein